MWSLKIDKHINYQTNKILFETAQSTIKKKRSELIRCGEYGYEHCTCSLVLYTQTHF